MLLQRPYLKRIKLVAVADLKKHLEIHSLDLMNIGKEYWKMVIIKDILLSQVVAMT